LAKYIPVFCLPPAPQIEVTIPVLGIPQRLPIFLDCGIFISLLSASTSSASTEGAEWQLTGAGLDEQYRDERLL